MLPTFIIGLREGLEAALIVGIIAAFLAQQGRRDALHNVWIGTGAAIVICVAIGVILEALSRELPQKQQEGLETVIGFVAVAMVTTMIIWMGKHARSMKGDLESSAAGALARGSAMALVIMAFLAVLREGFETSVFLLATFQHSTNPVAGGIGALLGIAVAVGIGVVLFKGGLKINLSRFFTATSVVLIVIAAGLVMASLRTAHEAGWINFGQAQPIDLTFLVRPGTPVSSLITGVLGITAKPAVVEIVGYLVYLVAMLAIVVVFAKRQNATAARPATPVHATRNAATPEPAVVAAPARTGAHIARATEAPLMTSTPSPSSSPSSAPSFGSATPNRGV